MANYKNINHMLAVDGSGVTLTATAILNASDWTQLPDAPLSAENKEKYRVFRQKVRDLPAKYNDNTKLDEIEWPSP